MSALPGGTRAADEGGPLAPLRPAPGPGHARPSAAGPSPAAPSPVAPSPAAPSPAAPPLAEAAVPPPAVPSTRDRLLAAGREVVEAHGYGGASVAAIADRAGVAAGTLYRHFGSKAELVVEVFRAVCGRELAAMRAAAEAVDDGGDPDPVERVLAPLDAFAARALQNRALAWALLAEPVDGPVDEVRLEYRRTYRDLLAELVADAVRAGAIPEQDARLTAAALVGAVGEVLVGPLSAAARPSATPVGAADDVPCGTDPQASRAAAPPPAPTRPPTSDGPAPEDAALLADLRVVCRRATGAASRVRADAPGEPR